MDESQITEDTWAEVFKEKYGEEELALLSESEPTFQGHISVSNGGTGDAVELFFKLQNERDNYRRK